MRPRSICFLLVALFAIQTIPAAEKKLYESGTKSRSGIGKYFKGREIAHFMSHMGAPWLERGERDKEERPDLLMKALALKPGMHVADIGCGSGFYARKMAKEVGNTGLVYGVDIQKEMLVILRKNMQANNATNFVAVLSDVADPKLPAGKIDLALFVDVYHEFEFPHEMMLKIAKSLKKGGRVVLVEYRQEDPEVPIKYLHKMTQLQVAKEMSLQPDLEWQQTIHTLPWQHVIIYQKK
ncbi:MAG: precorrin-6B methylase 2 [Limisphaerales bacterium]|jgi:precorrin-6B methylase 2